MCTWGALVTKLWRKNEIDRVSAFSATFYRDKWLPGLPDQPPRVDQIWWKFNLLFSSNFYAGPHYNEEKSKVGFWISFAIIFVSSIEMVLLQLFAKELLTNLFKIPMRKSKVIPRAYINGNFDANFLKYLYLRSWSYSCLLKKLRVTH